MSAQRHQRLTIELNTGVDNKKLRAAFRRCKGPVVYVGPNRWNIRRDDLAAIGRDLAAADPTNQELEPLLVEVARRRRQRRVDRAVVYGGVRRRW